MGERALLIRLGAIGDTILASSVVGQLKAHYPDMEIDFLASSGLQDLLSMVPGISRVHVLPYRRIPFMVHPHWIALRRRLDQEEYCLAYLMEADPRFLPLLEGLTAERKIATSTVGKEAGTGADLPVALWYQKVLRYSGLVPEGVFYPRLVPWPRHEERVDRLLASLESDDAGEGIIGIQAGNSFRTRKRFRSRFRKQDIRSWPEDRWSDLICRMHRCGRTLSFVLFGAEPDMAVNQRIENRVRGLCPGIPLLNAAGKTDLPLAVALLKRFALFLSTDTGPIHMAAAAGVPLVGLYGPTRFEETRPFSCEAAAAVLKDSRPCQPCYGTPRQKTCRDNLCMQSIRVEDVLAKVIEMKPDLFEKE